MRILLAEDDDDLAAALIDGLQQSAYTVARVADGPATVLAINSGEYSMAIVDLGLPGLSGLDVIRRVRQDHSRLPILILTARGTPEERVEGLDAGADDYLVKPFDFHELLARLRALRRRIADHSHPVLSCGALEVDTRVQAVRWQQQQVELGRREYMLLVLLLENADRVVPRHRLETELYGWLNPVSSNAIEVHVHHLRRKLSEPLIRTIRGVGYMLCSDI